MEVSYKDCSKCSHYDVCAFRERYDSVIEKVTEVCAEVECSDKDFSAYLNCKHFIDKKGQAMFR